MIKRILVAVLAVASLCMAVYGPNNAGVMTSDPMFAYTPFPMDGLNSYPYQNDGHTKYAYAPYTIQYNGAFHQFYCSNGQDSDNFFNPEDFVSRYNSKDHIRYRSSKDGVNWSAPRIVMTVSSKGSETCACDPSVVYGDDGYWYMLYTSEMNGYAGTVVLLARSKYVQGPYFRYMADKKWEDESSSSNNPRVMLGTQDQSEKKGVIGQQTIVKVPGKNGNFWVWYRDLHKNFRFASVASLTELNYNNYLNVKYCDGDATDSKCKKEDNFQFFGLSNYVIGEVRYNVDKTLKTGGLYLEMWSPINYMVYDSRIAKFWSNDGIHWYIKNVDKAQDDLRHIPNLRYSYIHNIGVAGDEYGRIYGDKYLVSFAAPAPGWTTDHNESLNACDSEDGELFKKNHASSCAGLSWQDCYRKYTIYCISNLHDDGFNIVKHRGSEDIESQSDAGGDLGGKWSIWQQLVGADWFENDIDYTYGKVEFPHNVTGTNIDYFTGDYDGDGIADLGALDRSTYKWYIYSSRGGSYIHDGAKLIPEMNSNFEVVTGDYDGDGETDIGAVDTVNGRWYIMSSKGNKKGIGTSSNKANYIPWGWKWDKMNSSSKIVVGDYNGDGITDRAIYNGSKWYIISSESLNSNASQGFKTAIGDKIEYGWTWSNMNDNYVVIPGDFDGDGITDRAVYRKDNGQWSSYSSRLKGLKKLTWRWNWTCKNGSWGKCKPVAWGSSKQIFGFQPFSTYQNMRPITGDVDGAGVTDFVLVGGPSNGVVKQYGSMTGKIKSYVWAALKKSKNPVFVSGDYDGDGKMDLAFVDKDEHLFHVMSSRSGTEGINYTIKSVLTTNSGLAKSASEKPIEEPKVSQFIAKAPSMDVSVNDRVISVANVENGTNVAVFNVLGKKIFSKIANEGSVNFELPSRGKFIVRAGSQSRAIMVK